MNKKQKIGFSAFFVFLLAIGLFFLYQSTQKITYIEYEKYGEVCEQPLNLCDNQTFIEQEFKIPYQMFSGISLRIGNYGRENNARYELTIKDKTKNQQITTIEFNTSQVKDEEYYELLLDSPIKIDNTHQFSITLKAKSLVNAENGVAFYADSGKETKNNGKLYYNQTEQDANLCMKVYGGNSDPFWFAFTLVCEIYGMAVLTYIAYLWAHQKPIKSNTIVHAGFLGILIFSLLTSFIKIDTFSDEADNMIGGMLVEKGRILYTDYYTQHTPFAYWLCSGFSALGAVSVPQFRLLYYGLITFIYIGLFFRHQKSFGKIKMMLIPIMQITFGAFLATETTMILSDNIQAICMIALLLEFLQYLKDKKLNWGRAIIVSLSIFCGFGSAFVSAYAIFAIVVGVMIQEIKEWKKCKINFTNCMKRYWKLGVACAIPFVVAFGYFIMTHSLKNAYEQAFKFNTTVYSVYLEDGFGSNVLQPFLLGITNFLQIIPRAIISIIENTDVALSLTKLLITAILIAQLLKLISQKEYLKAGIIFLCISFSFTRVNEAFHEIAIWSLIVVANIVLLDEKKLQENAYKFTLILATILIFGGYMNQATQTIFQSQKPISELEKQIMEQTLEGEEIFYDIYSYPSIYLISKNRVPMNRLTFILPWYMDWYEIDVIQDLISHHPKVVLYDEEAKVWEISGYDDYLRKYLHENYEQTDENSKVWILK